MSAPVLTSIGHGTAAASALTDLLASAGIRTLVDVRRFPGSRRYPHVGKEQMARWLSATGITYRWMPALGGRRRPVPDSANVGLRNPQFRAYADYMGSDEFAVAVGELLGVAASGGAAIMCSETVWWRCHRRLLADHLVLIAHWRVEHLFHDGHQVVYELPEGVQHA